jgi:DNA-binding protein Fis
MMGVAHQARTDDRNHPRRSADASAISCMKDRNLRDSLNGKLERLVHEMCVQEIPLPAAAREFEKKFLQAILRRCGGNRTRAARLLGIHRNTLANKIALHRL